MDNISETVLTHVIGHILAEKSLVEFELEEADYLYTQELFMKTTLEDIKKHCERRFKFSADFIECRLL